MGGTLDKVYKIISAIKSVIKIDRKYRYDVESILCTFFTKFFQGKDLVKLKEELRGTELGRSVSDEGKRQKL